eukprot:Selendium_serpulae@DN5939_c4_g1_i1.p1
MVVAESPPLARRANESPTPSIASTTDRSPGDGLSPPIANVTVGARRARGGKKHKEKGGQSVDAGVFSKFKRKFRGSEKPSTRPDVLCPYVCAGDDVCVKDKAQCVTTVPDNCSGSVTKNVRYQEVACGEYVPTAGSATGRVASMGGV